MKQQLNTSNISQLDNLNDQIDLIKRGIVELINEAELRNKLINSELQKKPLIIKLGVDPTAPDIHLGHTVVIRKLRHFQILGHHIKFLIGDFTGRIGDPSGKDKTRPPLTEEDIYNNAKTYIEQVDKILDKNNLEIVYNSKWLKSMTFEDVVKMTAQSTMSKLMEHNTFKSRFNSSESIRMHEFLYPFMQGYDSVALKADVELGGTDQTFNLTFGRELQKSFGQEPQICITMPLIVGTDGEQKMSKSLGNYVGIDEAPPIMFEKIMRMNDSNIVLYFTLLTDVPLPEIDLIEQNLDKNSSTEYILSVKEKLAYEIVSIYHGQQFAEQAMNTYGKQVFDNIPELSLDTFPNEIKLIELIKEVFNLKSKSESRRLIIQGAVIISGEKITNPDLTLKLQRDMIIKAGKTKIVKIK